MVMWTSIGSYCKELLLRHLDKTDRKPQIFKQVPITGLGIDIQKAPECEAALEDKDFDILYIF